MSLLSCVRLVYSALCEANKGYTTWTPWTPATLPSPHPSATSPSPSPFPPHPPPRPFSHLPRPFCLAGRDLGTTSDLLPLLALLYSNTYPSVGSDALLWVKPGFTRQVDRDAIMSASTDCRQVGSWTVAAGPVAVTRALVRGPSGKRWIRSWVTGIV